MNSLSPSNSTLYINGSLSDIKSGQAFENQPVLQLEKVLAEDVDYVLEVPKGASARAYWTTVHQDDNNVSRPPTIHNQLYRH
jgi:hypothetical protein